MKSLCRKKKVKKIRKSVLSEIFSVENIIELIAGIIGEILP